MRPGAPLIGTDLELTHELGRGGMGAVWAARERSTGRRLAVKLLGRADRPEQLERFRREGQVVAQLDHPGIVRIHSAGECDHGPYLVYELVEGARPVDEALEGLPLRRQVELIRDAARALGHAHRRGVVHRDVKPPNLLVDAEGRLRVTDFGVAAMHGASRLTRTGALVGTPTHMAPEQLRDGRTVGPWTDVWALGVVLYQALTGELPFQGDSLPVLAAAISHGELTPPRSLVPGLDPGLEAICLRALAREGSARYPDGLALADDLERWLTHGEPLAAGRPGVAPALLAAAACALAAGALLAVLLLADASPGPTADAGAAPVVSRTPGAPAAAVASAAPIDAAALAIDPELLALLPQPWPPGEGPGSAREHERATSQGEMHALNAGDQLFLDQAVNHRDRQAMVVLSRAYEEGLRVPRSLARALHWLFKAAELDEPSALVYLGDRYMYGQGVPQDLERAVRCWRRASAHGCGDASWRLTIMLAQGPERAQALPMLELALRQAEEGEGWHYSALSLQARLLEERGGQGDLVRADELAFLLRRQLEPADSLPLIEYLVYSERGDAHDRRMEALTLWQAWRTAHPGPLRGPELQRLSEALGD